MNTQFYVIEPEVAGGWGENIIVDRSSQPVRVVHLHFKFEGWLGDELLTTHPVYICTSRMADALKAGGMSGIRFAEVEISRSVEFDRLYPSRTLPQFVWLQIIGEAEKDDLGLREDHLVISEKALSCLQSFPLSCARIEHVTSFEWDKQKHTDQLFAEAKAFADELRRKRSANQ